MKRARFTEEQIIGILRENEVGAKAGELARKHGVSEGNIYAWKATFGGMGVSDQESALSELTRPPVYQSMTAVPTCLLTRNQWSQQWRVVEYATQPDGYVLTLIHTPAGQSLRRIPLYREENTKAFLT